MREAIDNRIRRIGIKLAYAGYFWARNDLDKIADEVAALTKDRDRLKARLQEVTNLVKGTPHADAVESKD